MYEMKEGILIRNTTTGEVGRADEFTYTSFMVYRCMKEPNCVYVIKEDGERQLWLLKDCEPADVKVEQEVKQTD